MPRSTSKSWYAAGPSTAAARTTNACASAAWTRSASAGYWSCGSLHAKSFTAPVPDRPAFTAAGQTLLAALHPLPKGIRLLGLGLHNLCESAESEPLQLGLAI